MPSRPQRSVPPLLAILSSVWLAACGGGGGGGTPPPAPNAAPTFGTLSFAVSEDSNLTARVTATDPEGGALTFSKTSDPTSGTVSGFASDGSFTYRGNADFFGTDSFGVRVTDPANNAVTATVTITVTAVNDLPRAANDYLEVTTSGATSLNVLANDRDVDGDVLTVTIEGSATIGTATVNADRSVRLALPAGFRGASGFEYRVTEPDGGFVRAKAVVFVDAPAYRLVLPLAPQPGTRELYLHDLIDGVQLGQATQGALRLDNFAASLDGSTVVFTRADPAQRATTQELLLVKTRTPAVQVPIAAPAGTRIEAETGFAPALLPLAVSHDGRWIAFIATPAAGGAQTNSDLFVYDTQNPATAPARVGGAEHAYTRAPRFSASTPVNLYFLASATGRGASEALYRVDPAAPASAVRLSAPQAAGSNVISSFITTDQSRALLYASRPGESQNLYRVDLANPGTEVRLSTNLGANDLVSSFVLSRDFSLIAYTHENSTLPAGRRLSRVGTSGTPSPLVIDTPGADYVGRANDIRHDNGTVIYTRVPTVGANIGTSYEIPATGGTPTVVMGPPASFLLYDGTGDRVFTVDSQPRITTRADFGTAQPFAFQSFNWLTANAGPQRQSIVMSTNGFAYLFNLAAPGVALQLTNIAAAPLPSTYLTPPLLPVGPAPAN